MDLKIKDLVELLGVPEKTIRQWVKDDRIPHHVISHQVRFHRAEINEWILDARPELASGLLELSIAGRPTRLTDLLRLGGIHYDLPGRTVPEILKNALESFPTPDGPVQGRPPRHPHRPRGPDDHRRGPRDRHPAPADPHHHQGRGRPGRHFPAEGARGLRRPGRTARPHAVPASWPKIPGATSRSSPRSPTSASFPNSWRSSRPAARKRKSFAFVEAREREWRRPEPERLMIAIPGGDGPFPGRRDPGPLRPGRPQRAACSPAAPWPPKS